MRGKEGDLAIERAGILLIEGGEERGFCLVWFVRECIIVGSFTHLRQTHAFLNDSLYRGPRSTAGRGDSLCRRPRSTVGRGGERAAAVVRGGGDRRDRGVGGTSDACNVM